MPEIITCPDCGRKLRVPDTLVGKKVKCPDCNTKFTGGITTAPTGKTGTPSRSKRPDADDDDRPKKSSRRDDDDDRPRKNGRDDDDRPRSRDRDDDDDHPRRRRRPDYDEDDDRDDDRDRDRGPAPGLTKAQKRSGWKMTLLGMNLIVYASYVLIAMVAVSLLGCSAVALIAGIGASSGNINSGAGSFMAGGVVALLLYLLLFLMELAFVVLQVTGHGFCMAVPHKIGTARKAMAIATFACACVILLLGLGCGGMSYSMRNNYSGSGGSIGPGPFFCLLPLLLAIGYHVCFMLFLRMVAQAMREPAVAKQVLIFMITLPCVLVATILAEIVMVVVMFGSIWSTASSGGNTDYLAAGGIFGFICGILFLCIYIGLFVWYVIVIHQVRNAVKNYVG